MSPLLSTYPGYRDDAYFQYAVIFTTHSRFADCCYKGIASAPSFTAESLTTSFDAAAESDRIQPSRFEFHQTAGRGSENGGVLRERRAGAVGRRGNSDDEGAYPKWREPKEETSQHQGLASVIGEN
jgi:hypothetical protein